MGKINITGSSSSIFQFDGRVWFEEAEIITWKAKVGGIIILVSLLYQQQQKNNH